MTRDQLLKDLKGIADYGESWGPDGDLMATAKAALEALSAAPEERGMTEEQIETIARKYAVRLRDDWAWDVIAGAIREALTHSPQNSSGAE